MWALATRTGPSEGPEGGGMGGGTSGGGPAGSLMASDVTVNTMTKVENGRVFPPNIPVILMIR